MSNKLSDDILKTHDPVIPVSGAKINGKLIDFDKPIGIGPFLEAAAEAFQAAYEKDLEARWDTYSRKDEKSPFYWIVEFRKGWLSQHVLKTFDNIDEAYAYEKQIRKEEWRRLKADPDLILTVSQARR